MKIKEIIREEFNKYLFENYNEDIDWGLYELKDNIFRNIVDDYIESKNGDHHKQKWYLIPFNRLKKIWEDYIRYGFIRDTKGMDMFEGIFTQNILKLAINTELSGHMQYYPTEELEDMGLTEDDLWNDDDFDFGDYIEGDNGQLRISDYGLQPLTKLLFQLKKENDYNKKLIIMDKMLNVVHQRSDIAGMFVEGGSASLDKLSGYYKKEEPNEPWSDEVSSISGKYKMRDYY